MAEHTQPATEIQVLEVMPDQFTRERWEAAVRLADKEGYIIRYYNVMVADGTDYVRIEMYKNSKWEAEKLALEDLGKDVLNLINNI